MKCIFCLTTNSSKFNTIEHILPESLGGGDWALLPPGMYCDSCQNKFGSSIEQQALADFPLVNYRTLLGVPTKKGKAPWFKYMEGSIYSAGAPGRIIYQPNEIFKKAYETGQKKLTIVPAMTNKPDMVLRTLLKMGIELIACDEGPYNVFDEIYDPARKYALSGEKTYPWFYLQRNDTQKLNLLLQGKLEENDPSGEVNMSILIHEGVEVFHLQLMYLQFFVPLYENVFMGPELKIDEPLEQLIVVN